MRAGDLDQWIELQEPVRVRDATGGETITYQKVVDRWAQLVTKPGRESFEEGQVRGTSPVIYRIRYYADVRSTWRVKNGNRIYNLAGPPIDVGGQGVTTELHCVEIEEPT